MTQTQTQNLEQFSADVRARVANIDTSLKSLQTKVNGDAKQAEAEAWSQLTKVTADIEANKPRLVAPEAQVAQWVQGQRTATTQKVAEWKSRQDFTELQARAAEAERYAVAARDVAVAKLNAGHQAALEAFLAKKDADPASRQS